MTPNDPTLQYPNTDYTKRLEAKTLSRRQDKQNSPLLIASVSLFMNYLRDEDGKLFSEECVKNGVWEVREYKKGMFKMCPVIAELQVSGDNLEIKIQRDFTVHGITVRKKDSVHYDISTGKINRTDEYGSSENGGYLSRAFPEKKILTDKLFEQYGFICLENRIIKK